ncbi:Short-chain dehydrogenase [Nakamurella panacisegetis]|uniref:Short-chain dehydrogenase n=1 Tax=Nakamurella panacisegetis TaxID=1090615 RepID=A0A1H0QI68_9ACTN|nr:SDR family oxidoreductase [Nakamurella panacisegetis]SDP17083.1 Short-chain dehydrogenase [Nakamurella panacisegetis]
MTGLTPAGASVVVTGAGSGIGAALARALSAAGAHVTVNDLDAAAAAAVADEIGGLAHPADVADLEQVRGLVDAARARFGPVDLFCANAGVAVGGSIGIPAADWDLAWRVNVLQHVHAAEVLLPGWLERGAGRLLTTVSAAGILTMLGSAPYSVTKHAALAYSEWLRATYAHRGIVVQSLCPQGVRTPLFESTGDLGETVLGATALSADEVAQVVLAALGTDRFLILPHPEVADFAVRRATDPDRWLAGMNRLQQSMEQADVL